MSKTSVLFQFDMFCPRLVRRCSLITHSGKCILRIFLRKEFDDDFQFSFTQLSTRSTKQQIDALFSATKYEKIVMLKTPNMRTWQSLLFADLVIFRLFKSFYIAFKIYQHTAQYMSQVFYLATENSTSNTKFSKHFIYSLKVSHRDVYKRQI